MDNYNELTFEVGEEYDGERIDRFLAEIFTSKSRTYFQKLIKDELITIEEDEESKVVKKNSFSVSIGQIVKVLMPPAEEIVAKPEKLEVEVLYEDSDVCVVNKPKNMVVHPSAGHLSGTLVNFILYHCKDELSGINGKIRPGIVHRIDMDTTGSLIICKNDMAHEKIAAQLKDHSCDRIYYGIVNGVPKALEDTIKGNIGRDKKDRKKMAVVPFGDGKEAVTHYKVLKSFKGFSLVEFKLETGRTHQIRVHMKSIGHPLLGDELYAANIKVPDNLMKCGIKGQCLHAKDISFDHPSHDERIKVSAPLPEYFEKILEILDKTL